MTVVTLKDIVNRFEATQVAYVEKRDGVSGLTTMDPRVVGRTIALMAIVISDGSKSMARFEKMIEKFEAMNTTE
jgi:hypothetical protein